MNPERWRRIEQIVHSVLDLEPAKRELFLERACAGDELLRQEVDHLLKNQAEAEGFIESPAIEAAARAIAGDEMSSKEGPGSTVPAPASSIEDEFSEPRKRAPWWMYAVAAAFLICAGVRYYICINHPEPDLGTRGYPLKDGRGVQIGMRLTAVLPDSAAEKAGLEPGDVVLLPDADGLVAAPGRPGSGPYYWEIGRTYRLQIKRKEETRTVPITLRRDRLSKWFTQPSYRPALASLVISLLEFIIAVTIAFRRPYDTAARWGALFLGIVAIAIIYTIKAVYGNYSTILSLPRGIGFLTVMLPGISLGCGMCVGLTFLAVFPRRLFTRRWIWALIWFPGLIGVSLNIFSDNPPMYSFPRWYPDWYHQLGYMLGFAIWCALPVVLILNYLHLNKVNERRRLRVLVAGTAVAMIGYVPIIGGMALPSWNFLKQLLGYPYVLLLLFSSLGCALPISMAYVILRHRVFDIGVMIRMGVRYTAAKGMLLSLVPVVVLLWAGDLLIHRSQPLEDILGRRGLPYASMAGGTLLLHVYRRRWLDALDRRFFREHYDAQRVLRNVIEEIREARTFEKVAPRVVEQIEAALHPEFAALLMRRLGDPEFSVLAGGNRTFRPIASGSKLVALTRVLGKPVEISQQRTGWPWSHLPAQESNFLRQSRLEWLFPICLKEGQTEAFLAVGPKRSESPYSHEDQELLEGIASSLALLLEQSPAPGYDSQGFKECPECGICYNSDSDSCGKEGAKLTPYPFSRFIDRRYRFEQRLGQGGMGVVYKSFDTELERNVAIKLIHPHLVASLEAAARFKQEAKAAASFTHPNVVTVYDYGVAEDRRAYLVMELLRGSTLRQELQRNQRLSPERASNILSGICAAVEAAHKMLILHRDLKPENIFLEKSDGTETAKILDFGVVKFLSQSDETVSANQTEPGRLVGTLKYMSPEELKGDRPAESWDLWALAVVAYEMLAGVHPFTGSTVSEVRVAILDGRITPLQTHWPDAPEALRHFFNKALAFNPTSRPKSSLQLLSDFRQSQI